MKNLCFALIVNLKIITIQQHLFISCPVASVLYSKGKEEGRRKREEGRGKKEEGRGPKATLARKKPLFPVDIHPWVYTNDINGHYIMKLSEFS
ncbi:hypothetical protein [Okeania sp. KiyG1]|uniref:hypothetical protein n=1 Tax=Okeania sp. KiyG1 TaxID=2720165 RepID=UPI001F26BF6C|nr:hypothetical protein [Okeania sp. KiyG1]